MYMKYVSTHDCTYHNCLYVNSINSKLDISHNWPEMRKDQFNLCKLCVTRRGTSLLQCQSDELEEFEDFSHLTLVVTHGCYSFMGQMPI